MSRKRAYGFQRLMSWVQANYPDAERGLIVIFNEDGMHSAIACTSYELSAAGGRLLHIAADDVAAESTREWEQ